MALRADSVPRERKGIHAPTGRVEPQRRELPWEAVNKEYVFEGPNGKQTLPALFDGRSQLIVYHFMFHPSAEVGMSALLVAGRRFQWHRCALKAPRCDHDRYPSGAVQQVGGVPEADGLEFPVGLIVRDRVQFRLPRIFYAGTVCREKSLLQLHNARSKGTRARGHSVFYKDGNGAVFHCHSCYDRGNDMLNIHYHYLDLVPKGRDEAGRGPYWVRRHDEYDR